jgi:hypothetical protein
VLADAAGPSRRLAGEKYRLFDQLSNVIIVGRKTDDVEYLIREK